MTLIWPCPPNREHASALGRRGPALSPIQVLSSTVAPDPQHGRTELTAGPTALPRASCCLTAAGGVRLRRIRPVKIVPVQGDRPRSHSILLVLSDCAHRRTRKQPIPTPSTGPACALSSTNIRSVTCAQTYTHRVCAGQPTSEEPHPSDHTRTIWLVRASEHAPGSRRPTLPSSTNDAFVSDPRRGEEKHTRNQRVWTSMYDSSQGAKRKG